MHCFMENLGVNMKLGSVELDEALRGMMNLLLWPIEDKFMVVCAQIGIGIF